MTFEEWWESVGGYPEEERECEPLLDDCREVLARVAWSAAQKTEREACAELARGTARDFNRQVGKDHTHEADMALIVAVRIERRGNML